MAVILGLLFAAATAVLIVVPWTANASPDTMAREASRWYPDRQEDGIAPSEPPSLARDAAEDLWTGKPSSESDPAEGAMR